MSKPLFTAILAVLIGIPFFSYAVTVGPVKLEYSVDPGKTINGELFLQNDGQSTQTFYPSFEKFTENNGQKDFTKETSDLATWFKVASSVTLKATEYRQIPFTINVPKDAPPGGHFAVIWWSTTSPGGNGQQVSIVTRAGILVYLTVSGELKESAELSDFSGPRIATGVPVEFSFDLKNTGNSYLKPSGKLQIKNLFGGVSAEAPINEYGSNILPESSKTFSSSLSPNGLFFGIYHAQLTLTYGADNQTITKSFWFLSLPWLTDVVLLILIALIFFVIPRGLKKYNSWVIKKARG